MPLLCMLTTYNLSLARRAPKKVLSDPRKLHFLEMLTPRITNEISGNSGSGLLKRHALPEHPEAREPQLKPLTKDHYWGQAEQHLKRAERAEPNNKVVIDTKGAEACFLAKRTKGRGLRS